MGREEPCEPLTASAAALAAWPACAAALNAAGSWAATRARRSKHCASRAKFASDASVSFSSWCSASKWSRRVWHASMTPLKGASSASVTLRFADVDAKGGRSPANEKEQYPDLKQQTRTHKNAKLKNYLFIFKHINKTQTLKKRGRTRLIITT